MIRRASALLALSALLVQAAPTTAEPIIKPRKYHGPIPQRSFTLRVGYLAGPENTEMIEALDRRITGSEESFSEDFSNAFMVEGAYVLKLHPQFAVRANASASFLRTDGDGRIVARTADLPDTLDAPLLRYTREFDVDLFVLEASAIYYFADAAIQEFQTYAGGGFSVGFPHAKFNEVRIDEDTGELFNEIDRDEWSFEPGVHAILGASYFITNAWAINGEARGHILQSSFPINVYDRSNDRVEEVNVIVTYTGFMISVGVTRAF
jgi:hypothetical protein